MNKKTLLAAFLGAIITLVILHLNDMMQEKDKAPKPATSSCDHLRYKNSVIITSGFYKGRFGQTNEISELNRVGVYLYDGPYVHIDCSKVENLKDFDIQGHCRSEVKNDDPKAEEKIKKCLDKAIAILED